MKTLALFVMALAACGGNADINTNCNESHCPLPADLAITPSGLVWLKELGFEPSKRQISRACLDWTERVPHLAGAAGAHLCSA